MDSLQSENQPSTSLTNAPPVVESESTSASPSPSDTPTQTQTSSQDTNSTSATSTEAPTATTPTQQETSSTTPTSTDSPTPTASSNVTTPTTTASTSTTTPTQTSTTPTQTATASTTTTSSPTSTTTPVTTTTQSSTTATTSTQMIASTSQRQNKVVQSHSETEKPTSSRTSEAPTSTTPSSSSSPSSSSLSTSSISNSASTSAPGSTTTESSATATTDRPTSTPTVDKNLHQEANNQPTTDPTATAGPSGLIAAGPLASNGAKGTLDAAHSSDGSHSAKIGNLSVYGFIGIIAAVLIVLAAAYIGWAKWRKKKSNPADEEFDPFADPETDEKIPPSTTALQHPSFFPSSSRDPRNHENPNVDTTSSFWNESRSAQVPRTPLPPISEQHQPGRGIAASQYLSWHLNSWFGAQPVAPGTAMGGGDGGGADAGMDSRAQSMWRRSLPLPTPGGGGQPSRSQYTGNSAYRPNSDTEVLQGGYNHDNSRPITAMTGTTGRTVGDSMLDDASMFGRYDEDDRRSALSVSTARSSLYVPWRNTNVSTVFARPQSDISASSYYGDEDSRFTRVEAGGAGVTPPVPEIPSQDIWSNQGAVHTQGTVNKIRTSKLSRVGSSYHQLHADALAAILPSQAPPPSNPPPPPPQPQMSRSPPAPMLNQTPIAVKMARGGPRDGGMPLGGMEVR